MINWRALAALVLAFVLCAAAAQAEELLCVSRQGQAALIERDGSDVVPPGRYADVFRVGGNRYALGEKTDACILYALCDEAGRLLTDARFGMLQASGGVILFRQDGLYGAMDMDGNVLVAPEYTQLTAAGEGCFLAMTDNPYDEDADGILLISADGSAQPLPVYTDEGLEMFSDGLMPYQDPSTELYGYLGADGSVAIPAAFETADAFRGGVARASLNGKLGIIGTDGAWRIGPEYDYLESGDGVIAGLIGRGQAVVFDGACRELFRVEGSQLELAVTGPYPVLLEGDVLRVYTAQGDVIYTAGRGAAVSAGPDGGLIVSDGPWGSECAALVRPDGTAAGKLRQHILPLNEDRYAFVRMNAAAYFSDELDEIRYSVDPDSMRCGMMDPDGNEILPAEYLEICALGEDRYLACAQDGMQIVDGDGNVIRSLPGEE